MCAKRRWNTLWTAAERCGHVDIDLRKSTSRFSKMEMQKLTHTTLQAEDQSILLYSLAGLAHKPCIFLQLNCNH